MYRARALLAQFYNHILRAENVSIGAIHVFEDYDIFLLITFFTQQTFVMQIVFVCEAYNFVGFTFK